MRFLPIVSLQFIVSSIFIFAADGGSIYDDAPYQTVQFAPNVTHRTDLCDRQRLLRSGDIEFQDVLRGLELSVGLIYIPGLGLINYDERSGTFAQDDPGFYINLLDELSELAGFSWRNTWGVIVPNLENHTANDFLKWTVEVYDISFSEWDRTIERMKLGVDFPAGFSDSSTILIARNTGQDKTTFNPFSFLLPFDWVVWMSICGTIIFTGLVYRGVSKVYHIGQSTLQTRDEIVTEHVEGANIFYAALTATGHMEFSPVTYGERILVLSLCFWALVISATYTANLASWMISRNQPMYPATSLTEAQARDVPVCIAKGYAAEYKLKSIHPNVKYVESEGLTGIYKDLFDGKCGLAATPAGRFEVDKLNQDLNPDCSLEWVGRAVDISSAGPAVMVDAGIHCTSLVGHVFEYYLKEMERRGIIENAFDQYVKSVTSHQCPEEEATSSSDTEDTFSLTMVDMGGIFLVHGVACLVGLLVSILQRYCGRKSKDCCKKLQNNDNADAGSQVVDDGDARNAIITTRQLGSGGY